MAGGHIYAWLVKGLIGTPKIWVDAPFAARIHTTSSLRSGCISAVSHLCLMKYDWSASVPDGMCLGGL
jgi:hypothetical protein